MASSPFHSLGYIGPQHEAAWAVMRRYDQILAEVVDDLLRSPPEYILIQASVLGGKTTFGYQLLEWVGQRHREMLLVYLDLGGLGMDPKESQIVQRIQHAIQDRLAALIESGSLQDQLEQSARAVVGLLQSEGFGDLDDLLRTVLQNLDVFDRVVLVIDRIGALSDGLHEAFQERLRSIHSRRTSGPLKRFSVVLLAESLRHQRGAVSPLSNVVKRYSLDDFTRAEFVDFIGRCESELDGTTFQGDAVEYIFNKTNGQLVMVQKICDLATRCKPPGTRVEVNDAREAIALCCQEPGGVVPRLLGQAEALKDTATTRNRLDEILRGSPVLNFEAFPGVAQLVNAGIIKRGADGKSIFRSPLLREMLLWAYMDSYAFPVLSKTEQYLLTLPHVLSVVVDDQLSGLVRDAVPNTSRGPFSAEEGSELEDLAMDVLRTQNLDIDAEEIRFFFNRYYPNESATEIGQETILMLMARVYLSWCHEELRG